jgi:hypothetical protein
VRRPWHSPIPGEEALIVHGEISIARVEPDGHMAWERLGRDIFSGPLRMDGGVVEVTDFYDDFYRFRVSDGEVLAQPDPRAPMPPPQPAGGWMERLRAWLG